MGDLLKRTGGVLPVTGPPLWMVNWTGKLFQKYYSTFAEGIQSVRGRCPQDQLFIS